MEGIEDVEGERRGDMTHTHHKWDCPKSNGRHEWEWDKIENHIVSQFTDKHIGIPVHCSYACGALGIEWYEFKEIVEGE